MKILFSLLILSMLAGCDTDGRHEYRSKYDGHDIIVLQNWQRSSTRLLHNPECAKCMPDSINVNK